MQAVRASIFAERSVRFEAFDLPDQLTDDRVLVKTERTIVSAGTELANYTGLEPDTRVPGSWCAYPWLPGYGGIGRIVAIGPEVKNLSVGQRVYGFFNHASHQLVRESSDLLVQVPEELDVTHAVMARMFSIAITGFQQAHAKLRDVVVIIGLGLVGNMAGQYYVQAGQTVIGLDIAPSRRRLAEEVGFAHTLDPAGLSDRQIAERLREFTSKQPRVVVDAVGSSQLVATAVNLVADNGEVIMLGSPRAPYETNATLFLGPAHKRGISIVGALEWVIPVFKRQSPGRSIEANTETIFRMLVDGGLKAAPLCSHVLPPGQLNEAYRGLLNSKDSYIGVVLDWENQPAPAAE